MDPVIKYAALFFGSMLFALVLFYIIGVVMFRDWNVKRGAGNWIDKTVKDGFDEAEKERKEGHGG